jgi:hypothetical protein
MWQVTTHDNQRKAFLEASKHGERVHGNVFVMTGKRREKWSQHPRVGTDATLISCSVYRVFCKGSSLSGTTITASDASLLAEAITKGGGQVQIVYHFSAQ